MEGFASKIKEFFKRGSSKPKKEPYNKNTSSKSISKKSKIDTMGKSDIILKMARTYYSTCNPIQSKMLPLSVSFLMGTNLAELLRSYKKDKDGDILDYFVKNCLIIRSFVFSYFDFESKNVNYIYFNASSKLPFYTDALGFGFDEPRDD